MMRLQRIGKVYLAGLVIAAAVLHCATLIVAAALLWGHRDRPLLALNLVLLGIIPAIVASALALRAWKEAGGRSAAWSCGGLVVLLGAMALSRVRGGAF